MVRLTSKLNTQVDHVFRLVKTKERWQSDSEGENVCIPSFCCLSLSSVMKTTHRFRMEAKLGQAGLLFWFQLIPLPSRHSAHDGISYYMFK